MNQYTANNKTAERRQTYTGSAAFSAAYADQNERDFDALIKAVRTGGVEARQVEL